MFLAQSEIAREVDSAFAWIGGICVVLLVGITVVMVWFLLRYRRDRNPKATQIEGHFGLEVTWIVIPTILVLFMFFKGMEGFRMMRNVPEGAMVIDVTAQRWFWTFSYPDAGISSGELYVPVNTPVKLEMTAPPDDVVHSLYLPAFRVKEDCVPGKDTYLWFEAEKEGEYNIFCAEYCGRDHSSMLTKLHVLSGADYELWVKGELAALNKPVEIDKAMNPESEEIIACNAPDLYATYCASCHGPTGKGGLVEKARDFTSLADWQRGPKLTDIYRTLTEGLEGTEMRAFTNIRPWDRFALAHHVASFYKGSDRPATTDEDAAALMAEYKLDQVQEPTETISIDDAMQAIAAEAAERKDG